MAATTAVAATAGWPVDGMDPIDGRGRHPPQVKIIIVHSESAKQRRASTAPHRTAPHRTASHRTASHRIALNRIALNRIASH